VDDLPVTYSERHGIANQDNCHDRVTTYVVVAVDHVVDTECDADRRSKSDASHSKDESKPVYTMRSTNPPEYQEDWHHH
jgi:hypothetical protein